jgi:ferric-dicitrate binding protein FerR (iron transport regulator)
MSPEPCTRVRDAAAVHRVWVDAALLEHAQHCDVCAIELAALKKRREFRDAFPVLTSIADQSPREHTPPQVTADEARLRAARRRRLLLMIATLVAMGFFFARSTAFRARSAPADGDGTTTPLPPKFRIANIADAVFESNVEGGTVRSSMSQGMAAFHVAQLGPGQRFFLALPDGDVEVRGTNFVVTIEGGKTRSVEVNEGSVALRLQGRAEMLLSAGQRWPGASGGPTVSFLRLGPRSDAAPPPPSPAKE